MLKNEASDTDLTNTVLSDVRDAAPGSAYVDVQPTPTGVTVRMTYPAGRSAVVKFDCKLTDEDYRIPVEISCVLAVQIKSRPTVMECTVLGTSHVSSGPRRIAISLANALALSHSGAHTVFIKEPEPVEVHDEAELLEHAVSNQLMARVDTKLNYPTRIRRCCATSTRWVSHWIG